MKMHRIRREIAVINLQSLDIHTFARSWFAASTDIPFSIKSADGESEDARSIHQNPLVVCY